LKEQPLKNTQRINNPVRKPPAPWKGVPGVGDLLRLANRLSLLAKRAEDPEEWEAKCWEQARMLIEQAEEKKEQGKSGRQTLLLKATQALREAGNMNADVALTRIYLFIVHMGEDERKGIPNDPASQKKIDEILLKQCAIIEREGLSKDDKLWELDDPKAPEDHITNVKDFRRHRTAAVLRYFGEYDIANLLVNDPATFTRRFKTGLLEISKGNPRYNDDFFEGFLKKIS
jgi:hypothetical protein